jgi:hypothetical protein
LSEQPQGCRSCQQECDGAAGNECGPASFGSSGNGLVQG